MSAEKPVPGARCVLDHQRGRGTAGSEAAAATCCMPASSALIRFRSLARCYVTAVNYVRL